MSKYWDLASLPLFADSEQAQRFKQLLHKGIMMTFSRKMQILFASSAATLLLITACSSETKVEPTEATPNDKVAAQQTAAEAASGPTAVNANDDVDDSATTRPAVDPACLATVAWFEDREADDIKLNGCRSASELPAIDEQGWRQFEGDGGERIMTRGENFDPKSGTLSFEVGYNGGGTLSGKYRVMGKPTADGVLKAGQYQIKPLD